MAIEITSQHSDKPKFINWLSASLNKIDDGMTMTNSISSAFSLANAQGVQLDVIGQSVGANRDIGVALSTGTSVLDDTHYQQYILARIGWNQWDGTIIGLYDLCAAVFPGYNVKFIDNQDMSFAVQIGGVKDALSEEIINAGVIIPKPMGVQISSITFGTVLIWNDLNTVTWNTAGKYTWDQIELLSSVT